MRTPALSTQLKNAQATIADLEKKLTEATKQKDSHWKDRCDFNAEIEQIQQMLDAVPNSIPRRAEGDYIDRKAITRLAAWLASSK